MMKILLFLFIFDIMLQGSKYFRAICFFDSASKVYQNLLFDNVYFKISCIKPVFCGYKVSFYEYPITFSVQDDDGRFIPVFKSVVRLYPDYIRMDGCRYLLNPRGFKYDGFPLAVDWVLPASNVDVFISHCCKSLRIYRNGGWI